MHDYKKILEEQGIAPGYVNCDFKNHPAIKERLSEIIAYASNPEENIFMAGTCGNGKTMTSVAINAAHARFYGPGAYFYNSEGLYLVWLNESRTGLTSNLSLKLSETRLLTIDDLGQGEISDSYMRFLYGVINKRSEWGRPTITTTNRNAVEFRNLFGEAIVSRLCSGKIWKFDGKDHRLEKTK